MKQRGRPAKPAGEAKRHSVGFSATLAMKEKIKAAAEQTGRSIASEIEHRLERSFRDDIILERLDGIAAKLQK